MGEGRISTSRSGRRRGLVVAGIGAAVGFGLLLVPGAANAATTSSSSSQSHTLQALTGGTVDKFDPSLGTLTRVDWTTEVTVTTELCAENLSTAAPAVPSGTTAGEVTVNFPAGTATTASVSGNGAGRAAERLQRQRRLPRRSGVGERRGRSATVLPGRCVRVGRVLQRRHRHPDRLRLDHRPGRAGRLHRTGDVAVHGRPVERGRRAAVERMGHHVPRPRGDRGDGHLHL